MDARDKHDLILPWPSPFILIEIGNRSAWQQIAEEEWPCGWMEDQFEGRVVKQGNPELKHVIYLTQIQLRANEVTKLYQMKKYLNQLKKCMTNIIIRKTRGCLIDYTSLR